MDCEIYHGSGVGARPTLALYTDSDHAGDEDTRRSTSSGVAYFETHGKAGELHRFFLGQLVKLQGVLSGSSCEAEFVAGCVTAKKLWLPLLALCTCMQLDVDLSFNIDAEAAIKAVRKGYSRQLAHMKLCHGVSVGWLHSLLFDILECPPTKVPGEKNPADVGTKRIVNGEHFKKLRWWLGLRPAGDAGGGA